MFSPLIHRLRFDPRNPDANDWWVDFDLDDGSTTRPDVDFLRGLLSTAAMVPLSFYANPVRYSVFRSDTAHRAIYLRLLRAVNAAARRGMPVRRALQRLQRIYGVLDRMTPLIVCEVRTQGRLVTFGWSSRGLSVLDDYGGLTTYSYREIDSRTQKGQCLLEDSPESIDSTLPIVRKNQAASFGTVPALLTTIGSGDLMLTAGQGLRLHTSAGWTEPGADTLVSLPGFFISGGMTLTTSDPSPEGDEVIRAYTSPIGEIAVIRSNGSTATYDQTALQSIGCPARTDVNCSQELYLAGLDGSRVNLATAALPEENGARNARLVTWETSLPDAGPAPSTSRLYRLPGIEDLRNARVATLLTGSGLHVVAYGTKPVASAASSESTVVEVYELHENSKAEKVAEAPLLVSPTHDSESVQEAGRHFSAGSSRLILEIPTSFCFYLFDFKSRRIAEVPFGESYEASLSNPWMIVSVNKATTSHQAYIARMPASP